MTNLSDLFPAGGNQVSFVADGTLSNGQTVILNADGTVSGVSGVTEGVGSETAYASSVTKYNMSTFDSDSNKVVVAYKDVGNSNYGTAVVGTVSGTSISFGTPVVFETADSTYIAPVFDSDSNKVVIAYRDEGNSGYGTAIVGTVSGTSISFGTAVVFDADDVENISATFDSSSNKVVVAYRDTSSPYYGSAIVGTVSGTSISFGTAVVFESAQTTDTATTYDANADRTVISYRDDGNSSYGTSIVGTVSGTAISFGTAVVFESALTTYLVSTYDANAQKVVPIYQDGGNSDYGTAIVGTVSGTSISFGTAVVFNAASSTWIGATYDANAKKVVICYRATLGYVSIGTISGTSISFGTKFTFNAQAVSNNSAVFDSNSNKVVIAYGDDGNSEYGTGVVLTVGSTTNTSFVGIADAAISDTASGNVTVKGGIAVNGLSSLTPGSDYYVQADGSISTVTTSPAVKIGLALSATSILLSGES
jgi:hypothetical protein